MYTNADCTIYHRIYNREKRTESYRRRVIQGVFWEDRKGANVIKSGMEKADKATIFIPFSVGGFDLKVGDRIVRGTADLEIDGSKISVLEDTYEDVLVVTSVDRMDYGSPDLQHWEVGGR